eukprot:SAG11_NODE_13263_length_662_cov_1.554174_1_plen_69_part_00
MIELPCGVRMQRARDMVMDWSRRRPKEDTAVIIGVIPRYVLYHEYPSCYCILYEGLAIFVFLYCKSIP